MKKRMGLLFTLTIAASLNMSGGVYAAANTTQQYIGDTRAKTIALENAGLSEQQVTFVKTHLDYDDGYVTYDVEFYSGNTEYDYEIDAVSGEIREYDYEIEYRTATSGATAQNNAANPGNGTNQYIGDQKAKSIALTHAGISESDTRRMDIDLDYEHGVMVYDIEFKSGRHEYEYEINAIDGTVLQSKIEYDD